MECWQCNNELVTHNDTKTFTIFDNMRLTKGLDTIVSQWDISKIKELTGDNIDDKYKRSDGVERGHHVICGECLTDRIRFAIR